VWFLAFGVRNIIMATWGEQILNLQAGAAGAAALVAIAIAAAAAPP